jgi:ribonucleoside-diphosphate reductase alpha chain
MVDPSHTSSPTAAAENALNELALSSSRERERLPDTRRSITHKFNINGHEGYITVGLFEDGRPGEVFIKMAKQGSTVRGLMDAVGILTSVALQHGVSVDELVRKFEYARFEPNGWTKNPRIGYARSVVDYVFRWLGDVFSDEYHKSHKPLTSLDAPDEKPSAAAKLPSAE